MLDKNTIMVVALHPALDVDTWIRELDTTHAVLDQRHFTVLTTAQRINAAVNAYGLHFADIIVIPFDGEVMEGCTRHNVPVVTVRPSLEYHQALTGQADGAYAVSFQKFASLGVHDIVIDNDGQSLHQVFLESITNKEMA